MKPLGIWVAAEIAVLTVATCVIWFSAVHDIECDWIDVRTGERLVITATSRHDVWNVAGARSGATTLHSDKRGLTWSGHRAHGTYDRAGRVTWSDGGVWRRVTDSAHNDLNWNRWRNLLRHWSVEGGWFGANNTLQISGEGRHLKATLITRRLTDVLTGHVTPAGASFRNSFGEQFEFTWDKRCRGTMTIGGETVAMDRID